jgi:hypothetical protein
VPRDVRHTAAGDWRVPTAVEANVGRHESSMATVRESQKKKEMTYDLGDRQRRTVAAALLMKAVCQQGGFSKVPSSALLPATAVQGVNFSQACQQLRCFLHSVKRSLMLSLFMHAGVSKSNPAQTLATIGCNCAHMKVKPSFT